MCDTFVALPDATVDGATILGKNSDREPNEAQPIVLRPAAEHARGTRVRATYITLDQAPRTHSVLLSKPYWIWGAEMGVNDAGVAIGNEAVFTKGKPEPKPGLLGMDLLRLALERADDAESAVAVITELLTVHGQSGRAGHTADLHYDNSYLIADPTEAFVLETVGRDWVCTRVAGTRSISNGLTIGADFDAASAGLQDATDVAGEHSDFLYTRFSDASARQCRTSDALAARAGAITLSDAMALLRDHGPAGADPSWTPAAGLLGQTVCAHAGFGPVRVSQSTAAMVAQLRPGGTTVWLTGTSATCLSVFKPVWLDAGLPNLAPAPGRHYNGAAMWWRHEDLHREVLRDYAGRAPAVRRHLADLEAQWLAEAATLATADAAATVAERETLTERTFSQAAAAEAELLALTLAAPATDRRHRLYHRAWTRFDRDAHRGTAS